MNGPTPDYDTDLIRFMDWAGPHWAWAFTFAGALVAMIWRAASLVSEIRAQRDDLEAFIAEQRAGAIERQHQDARWRVYIDSNFGAVNARLDRIADKG